MRSMKWAGLLLLLVLELAACKPRIAHGDETKTDLAALLAKHRASASEFNTLLLKGKADFHDGVKNEDITFTYKICIAKDSLISANISKLGFPVANMLVDHDSVRMRLPMTKEGVLCDLDMLSTISGIPMDYKTLQDFLVGNGIAGENAKAVEPVRKPLVLTETTPMGQLSYTVGTDHGKLERLIVKDPNIARESTLEYEDFRKINGQWIPALMRLTTTSPETTRIELKHTDIEIDGENTSFSFRIPEGYQIKPCKGK